MNSNSSQLWLLLSIIILLSSCSSSDPGLDMGESLFNSGWQFMIESDIPAKETRVLSEPEQFIWKDITLPHTPVLEPLVIDSAQWQGTCYYMKIFDNPEPGKDKYIALRFGAAMHKALIYLNGELIKEHNGGYLPFIADLSGKILDRDNILIVELNNEDNAQIPPGKPIAGLDFSYYGGLYRNVNLLVKDKIHFSDPVDANIVAGGGVFLYQDSLSDNQATFRIKTDIANLFDSPEQIQLAYSISNENGEAVYYQSTSDFELKAGASTLVQNKVLIEHPNLWSPDRPYLYNLELSIIRNGKVIDRKNTSFGLRNILFDNEGFYLNGQKLKIRGTNRHQEYPYVGYAIGDNADYRDAFKIKEAGFNFVRLSHYPHSESFLDACDELGLLVMDAIPGWQYVGDSIFLENSKQDLRDMIRRDRNHPSIILWEASLNESAMSYDFIEEMHSITKQELEGRDSYTCGWLDTIYDVFIPARQHAKPPGYWSNYTGERPLFIAEYGDWEYYAQNAGFNQSEYENLLPDERTSRQLRTDGQKRLSQQALNYQEAHNDNLNGTHAGDANWLMFDYNRGYAPDIESSGIMDIFRLAKFSYYFYASQKDLHSGDTVLFIANYWDDPDFTDVKIYSNCDSVELWLNNKLISGKGPDNDRYSTNLPHPPFSFKNLQFENGKLEARAFVSGSQVKSASRLTPGNISGIKLEADYSGKSLALGSVDIVFIHARLEDDKGQTINNADNIITFSIAGEGELIGDNPVIAKAGIASILYRSKGNSVAAKILAEVEGLNGASIELIKN